MISYSLSLSSNITEYIYKSSELQFDDLTQLNISVNNLSEKNLPLYLKIDWGDGNSEIFDNDLYVKSRDKINIFNYSPLFTETFTHEYYPSATSLYKSLTAQVFVNYSNGDNSWFIIPIKIRTYDYFESIYNMTLINTNILPLSTNDKQHQFITDKDGFTIELQG
jgi:hypothetical protein